MLLLMEISVRFELTFTLAYMIASSLLPLPHRVMNCTLKVLVVFTAHIFGLEKFLAPQYLPTGKPSLNRLEIKIKNKPL